LCDNPDSFYSSALPDPNRRACAQDRARIAFDCRTVNDAAIMSSTVETNTSSHHFYVINLPAQVTSIAMDEPPYETPR
jgi:hypothetical protein